MGPVTAQASTASPRQLREAGATTVIASLWPVDDADAAIFMTAFYRELGARCGQGWVDLLVRYGPRGGISKDNGAGCGAPHHQGCPQLAAAW